MRAIVHVAGITAIRGSYAYYEGEICASTTLAPLAEKFNDVLLIPLIPHSLITALDLDLNDFDGLVSEFLERAGLKGYEVSPKVVQVRGSFLHRGKLLRFKGSPVHTFTAVYQELKGKKVDEVLVDLSQGWNYLTVAAFLGATAFGEVYDVTVRPLTYEPFNPETTKTCKKGSPPVRTYRSEERTSLKLIKLEELDDLGRLVRSIVNFSSMEIRPKDVELAWKMFNREWGDKSELTFRPLAMLRKVSCALRINVIPYLHYSLRKLHEAVNDEEFKEAFESYEERVKGSYYLEPTLENESVKYPGAPYSYPLLDATLQAYRDIWSELGDFMGEEEWFPLSLVDRLISYYRSRRMHVNEYFLINEFRYEEDFKRADSAMKSLEMLINRRRSIGTAVGYLAPFYHALKSGRYEEEELKRANAYSYFMILKRRGQTYDSLRYVLDRVLSGSLNLKGRMWELLSYAFEIMRGRPVDEDRLVDLIRNLVAHAGVQHFSVRSIYPKEGGGDLKIYYYRELFKSLDELAKSGVGEAKCLCDQLLSGP